MKRKELENRIDFIDRLIDEADLTAITAIIECMESIGEDETDLDGLEIMVMNGKEPHYEVISSVRNDKDCITLIGEDGEEYQEYQALHGELLWVLQRISRKIKD